jgi:hypothetical protein
MTEIEREEGRIFIETWRRAGPVLEQIRLQELREFDSRKQWRIVDSLFDLGVRLGQPRNTSGLVEQQRIFRTAR